MLLFALIKSSDAPFVFAVLAAVIPPPNPVERKDDATLSRNPPAGEVVSQYPFDVPG